MVPVPVMAFMHLGPLPVSAQYITITGINSLSAKFVLAGEKLVPMYSIST